VTQSDFTGTNYSLRDEIRDFWSQRAATFDQSVGHEIFSEAERRAWHRLISRHLGPGEGRAALDLACGTAVISHLMHDLGYRITGLDWSEAMLEQARAKAQKRGTDIRFIMRDAENTLEPRESADVIITRHLVWTLVDPQAAFAEWFAVLKPGGKLLVVDGNLGHKTWVSRLHERVDRLTGRAAPAHMSPDQMARHRSIRSRVYFRDEMRAEAVVGLLLAQGFVDPVVDRGMFDIHLAQARKMNSLWRALERLASDRFAICVTKPLP
jgi:ubiquinone/menaquinone biosynthesis C-methylase UbiE